MTDFFKYRANGATNKPAPVGQPETVEPVGLDASNGYMVIEHHGDVAAEFAYWLLWIATARAQRQGNDTLPALARVQAD